MSPPSVCLWTNQHGGFSASYLSDFCSHRGCDGNEFSFECGWAPGRAPRHLQVDHHGLRVFFLPAGCGFPSFPRPRSSLLCTRVPSDQRNHIRYTSCPARCGERGVGAGNLPFYRKHAFPWVASIWPVVGCPRRPSYWWSVRLSSVRAGFPRATS